MSSTKPILIDALRINMGGGLNLLNYFVDSLIKHNIDFVLLRDERCPQLNHEDLIPSVKVLNPSLSVRKSFYRDHKDDFKSFLCFGNVPPPIKMSVPVFVYYHNVSLLKIPKDYGWKKKFLSFIKRLYIKNFAANVDEWIVQTSYTATLLRNKIVKGGKPIRILPFYHLPSQGDSSVSSQRECYVFIGEYTHAKGHEYLLEAWEILHSRGIDKALHLTVTDPVFCEKIKKAQQNGVNIVNHGHISYSEVADLYALSKATVYPSLNESLGLGIIEALEAGCDVLGSELPYLHSVCKPSEIFTPTLPVSIAEAVIRYERGTSPRSKILIKDEIEELIRILNHS